MINKSFNMRLWNVTFYKIRACCTYFSKFIRPLIAPMPYMCSNPLKGGGGGGGGGSALIFVRT